MMPIKQAIIAMTLIASMLTAGAVSPDIQSAVPVGETLPIVVAEPGEPPPPPPPPPPEKPPVKLTGRICYLTFDDGPDGRTTPAILDILQRYQVSATFFVLGGKAEQYPQVLRRIQADGHAIGNHTYAHNYALKQDATRFIADVQRAERAIQRATGTTTSILRVPGGSNSAWRTSVAPELTKLGYQYYDWNVDSRDALDRTQTAAQMAARVVQQVSRYRIANVLMHSINTPTTVRALPAIIEGIQRLGYEFRIIDSSSRPLHFSGN